MTDRERLIKLLFSADIPWFIKRRTREGTTTVEDIADHLLANGVTLPPEKPEPVPSLCMFWDPGHGYPTCFHRLREKKPCNCGGKPEKCDYPHDF